MKRNAGDGRRARRLVRGAFGALAAMAILSAAGCGPDECERLCTRNAECFDDAGSVETCADECRARSDGSESQQERVHLCLTCMERVECSVAADECLAPCT